jgi:anti-sigma factor RsiW
MMATSKKILEQEPSEIEMLLPWHAAGTLNARDARRVDEALARDPELAKQYAAIQEEYAETIHLNESLGVPSARAMQKLFAAIDGEPARKPSVSFNISARIAGFFAKLSPRTLAWSASLGALALLLQAGVIGAVLVTKQNASFQTASVSPNAPSPNAPSSRAPITRALGPEAPPRALVRFTPDARVADITALLDDYQASIIDGAKGGLFRLQFANRAMGKDEFASLMRKLQNEKIVSLAVDAQ